MPLEADNFDPFTTHTHALLGQTTALILVLRVKAIERVPIILQHYSCVK